MSIYSYTSGVFVEADPVVIERLLKALESTVVIHEKWVNNDYRYSVSIKRTVRVKVGGKSFELTGCHVTKWGNLSIYMESEDLLLRISDHWSGGSDVRNCGEIKSCHWELRTKTHTVRRFKIARVQCGFCKKSKILASKE